MKKRIKLFSEGSLSDFLSAKLERAKEEIKKEVNKLSDKEILKANEKDVVDKLYKKYSIQPIKLDEKNMSVKIEKRSLNENKS